MTPSFRTPFILITWMGWVFGDIAAILANSVDALLAVTITMGLLGGYMVGSKGPEADV